MLYYTETGVKPMQKKKILLLFVMGALAVTLLLVTDLPTLIEKLRETYAYAPLRTMVLYILLFVAVTVMGVPGAALLTTSSGYLFGLVEGTLLSMLSVSISAQLSFLLARYLLREWVETHFQKIINKINQTIATNGLSHLFLLRLIPGIPFPLLNMSYGVTTIDGRHFWWVTLLGTLPITLLLTNAGATLGTVESPIELFTPRALLSLLALGLFPIMIKWLIKKWSPENNR